MHPRKEGSGSEASGDLDSRLALFQGLGLVV